MKIEPKYCKITPVNNEDCKSWLELKRNDTFGEQPFKWFLAYHKSGVIWGKYLNDKQEWVYSDEKLKGTLDKYLMEIRFFGDKGELMIWPDEENEFRGRYLEDDGEADKNDPLRPDDKDRRYLFGSEIKEPYDGNFTTVTDKRGAVQKIPMELKKEDFEGEPPVSLVIKNYFYQEENSGMVKVACSRLFKLIKSSEIKI